MDFLCFDLRYLDLDFPLLIFLKFFKTVLALQTCSTELPVAEMFWALHMQSWLEQSVESLAPGWNRFCLTKHCNAHQN